MTNGLIWVTVVTNDGQGWHCTTTVRSAEKECSGGGAFVVDTGGGNDFVAFLFSGGSDGNALDQRAVDEYARIAGICEAAGQPLADIVGVIGDFDRLYDGCDRAEVLGGDGRDELRGGPGPDIIWGEEGSDGLFGNGGEDTLYGGPGSDWLDCRDRSPAHRARCHAYGEGEADHLVGSDPGGDLYLDGDYLNGGLGDDMIEGGAGGDLIYGSSGVDWLFGQDGYDAVLGQAGNDVLSGGLNPPGYPDYVNGGTHTSYDEFICRDGPFATPWDYDFGGGFRVDTDCDDGTSHKDIEMSSSWSPREEWAPRYDQAIRYDTTGDSVRSTFYTTSSEDVLNDERLAGATMLLQRGGALPFGGCFDPAGCSQDGVAYYLPDTGEWVFDHDLDGIADGAALFFAPEEAGDEYRLSTIRPLVGDFFPPSAPDGITEVGYFDPIESEVVLDVGLDGHDANDYRFVGLSHFWAGDVPLAGNFRELGKTNLLFFRPSDGTWCEVTSTSGAWVSLPGLAGVAGPGATPIAIDGDDDGLMEPATYVRGDSLWDYWPSLAGGTPDGIWWHGSHPREYPVVGDFWGDGTRDDIGLVDPSDGLVVLAYDPFDLAHAVHDADDVFATVAAVEGDAEPLRSRRVQSALTCGPQSLEMALRYRGLTEELGPGLQLVVERHLDWAYSEAVRDVATLPWDPGTTDAGRVSVGYRYSAEHILYDALRQRVEWPHPNEPALPPGQCSYASGAELENATSGNGWYDSVEFRAMVDYSAGHADLSLPLGVVRNVQVWDACSPGVGVDIGNEDPMEDQGRGLEGVARRAQLNALSGPRTPDAHTLGGAPDGVDDPDHFWMIVTSFITRGIPLVVGVERGGHFNAIVGFWEPSPGVRFIYTADPLDGAWRPFDQKPMRWQRFQATQELLDSGLVGGLLVFEHEDDGACEAGGWAAFIDAFWGDPSSYICL